MSLAAEYGHHEVVSLLADMGANLDLARDQGGANPVLVAAYNGHLGVVRVLAAKGANLDLKDEDGDTPLCVATQQGHHEVVGFLIAWLCHQHCLIRHRVGATYATLPVGHKERALYHFAYGKNKVNTPVAAEDAMLPRGLLPDDLFPLLVSYLVGRQSPRPVKARRVGTDFSGSDSGSGSESGLGSD